jgi:hypothetical protein
MRSLLVPQSQYKSLLISDRTTVDDVINILLNCYNSKERVEQFSLYEVCRSQEYQRKLHPDDCLLHVQHCWTSPNEFHFLIRRNLDFRPRTKVRTCAWHVPVIGFLFIFVRGGGEVGRNVLIDDAMNCTAYVASVLR